MLDSSTNVLSFVLKPFGVSAGSSFLLMWVKLGTLIPAIGIWSSLSARSSAGPHRVPPAVYPSSLKRRPYGVSCGNALWHVEQGWPVWRAKLGIAEAGFGASRTPAP